MMMMMCRHFSLVRPKHLATGCTGYQLSMSKQLKTLCQATGSSSDVRSLLPKPFLVVPTQYSPRWFNLPDYWHLFVDVEFICFSMSDTLSAAQFLHDSLLLEHWGRRTNFCILFCQIFIYLLCACLPFMCRTETSAFV